MISAGYAELYRGRYAEHCSASRKYRPWDNAQFFLHWYWRMQARLGSSEVRLQAGDIPNARIEVDDYWSPRYPPLILICRHSPGR